jgi:hypothetical protein
MACLERRRQDAAALIGTLATADPAVVTRAIEAVAGLPDIAMCADIAALRQRIPPPRDPATRAKLAALAPRLAEAQAKLDTGSYAAGLALARPIADEGRALGYRPFEAEADYVQGKLEADLGDTEHAGPTLEAAVLAAEAGRNDEIAARARIALVVLIGQDESDYARATALAPYAAAAIIRIGGNADLEFDLEEALGAVAYTASKLDIAQVHFQNALDIEQRAHGMDHPSAAQALRGLGINAMTQGRTAQAVALFERSLAIYERTLGPDHPRVARELAALGNAHVDDGQIDLAVQCLRRALAIHEVVLGPNHPTVGNDASDLARALRAEHHDAEALVLDRRAVAIGERTQGPDHPIYAEELMGLAGTLEQLHQFTEAAEQLRRAEAIFTKVYGPHHDGVVRVHAALAELLFAEARWRDAMAAYDRVIPELEHAQDIGSWLPEARINQAMAALELHQPARALAAIEPLSSHLDAQQARLRGTIRFVMARALWDRGSDRARVRELLATGRAELAAAGPEAAAGLIDLDAWVARHPAARPPAR